MTEDFDTQLDAIRRAAIDALFASVPEDVEYAVLVAEDGEINQTMLFNDIGWSFHRLPDAAVEPVLHVFGQDIKHIADYTAERSTLPEAVEQAWFKEAGYSDHVYVLRRPTP